MRTLSDLLLHLAESKGTDLHLIVGKIPSLRINGIIIPIEGEEPLAADRFAAMLADNGLASGDDSLFVPKDLQHRFRVTVFDIGEGLIARVIPTHIKTALPADLRPA